MAPIANLIRRAILTRAVTFGTKRLIVFLTPGWEHRAGGVLSIVAMYRESAALRNIHRAKVALCAVPGDDTFFFKYSWFRNHNYLLNLTAVLRSCPRLDFFLLHIPEYAVNQALNWLNSASSSLLLRIREVHLNVLLQNIECLQGQNVSELKRFGKVTCTTAHDAYTNPATRDALGVSVHKLGVCVGPEFYSGSSYREKEPLLVVSNDPHPMKEQVLMRIAEKCSGLKVQVIQNLSYEAYKQLIRRAKWSLTFGEGLDFYFAEEVWSGGVAFAVFNDRYFTPAFAALETVYPSWEVLLNKLPTDLQRLDNPTSYHRCWRQAYDLLNELYGVDRFRENLRLFYRGEYTLPWDPGSANKSELVANDDQDGQRLSAAAVSLRGKKSKSVKAMLVTHQLPEVAMPWMAEVRSVFDELVIFVDENRVKPGTVDRAKEVGSRVHLYKADSWYEWDLGAKARACDSDWVLQIEYDEQLSPEWQQGGWRELLETTEYTHFWIARRWTVPGGRYICDPPWWPDFQLRLFRNDQEGATFPARLHDRIQVPGPGGTLQSLVIYHHVLSLCSRPEREGRVRLYEQMRPGESGGHYYLHEKYRPSEASIPEPKYLNLDQEVIRMDALPKEDVSGISIKLMAAVTEVTVSAMFWLDVEVTNATNRPLYSCPPFPVHLSYHWVHSAAQQMIVFDGERSGVFPCAPANAITPWRMVVLAPSEPGEYILQMTVVQDGIQWFEDINPAILQELVVSVTAKNK